MLRVEGAQLFRARLTGSILSNRPVIITKIRELDDKPGVADYEVSFMRLVDKMTNGTSISINTTGTGVTVRPGYIVGGRIEHECEGRAVGYFLEGILPLCLFAKQTVEITLTGVTNDDVDICVDLFRAVTIPLLRRFGLEQLPTLEIVRRGLAPGGRGVVVFRAPVARELRAVQLTDPGFVRKVRGLAYAVRVSPQFANRMATEARGVFNTLLPDVYINTDHTKLRDVVPGYGMCIYAQTTTGCILGTKRGATRRSLLEDKDKKSDPFGMDDPAAAFKKRVEEEENDDRDEEKQQNADWRIPGVKAQSEAEEVAANAAQQLLEQIGQGGCVDATHQSLLFMLMTLCPEDVSKVRVGTLSPYSIRFLRLLKEFFGVTFRLQTDEETSTTLCACVGVGYKNLARKVT
mmetsp:Transcript_967/g.2285  ORF Transcript_967/g.2285 Transcript_967/m.2285 type:complete len:405 (-) Transcript_967:63-1277(-)